MGSNQKITDIIRGWIPILRYYKFLYSPTKLAINQTIEFVNSVVICKWISSGISYSLADLLLIDKRAGEHMHSGGCKYHFKKRSIGSVKNFGQLGDFFLDNFGQTWTKILNNDFRC